MKKRYKFKFKPCHRDPLDELLRKTPRKDWHKVLYRIEGYNDKPSQYMAELTKSIKGGDKDG